MEKNIDFVYRDILKEPPDSEEIDLLAKQSGVTHVGLINRKSAVFRRMGIDLEQLTGDEASRLIYDNPRIMIRPLFADEKKVYLGFKPHELEKMFLR